MTFDTERELNAYLERSGVIQQFIAQLVNADALTSEERTHARRFGAIARHAEVLRNLRAEARSGRIYLPLQTLDAAKVPHSALSAETASDAVRAVVASEAQRSLDEFHQRLAALSRTERVRLRPVLVFATLCARLLERLARGKYTAQPPLELGTFERVWLAWRTAVRAR
jgi:phytoene/squalene synthetase